MTAAVVTFSIIVRPDHSGPRVLLERTESGLSLPAHPYHEAGEMNDHLGDRLGLYVTTLDCLREDLAPDGGGVRVFLHEQHGSIPAPAPADVVWLAAPDLASAPLAVPEHRPLLLEVLSRVVADPGRRAERPWASLGWFAGVSDWTNARLRELGREPVGPLRQERVRTWSAIFTVDTSGGRVYFKAVPRSDRHEPRLTAALSGWFGGHVPTVLAMDADQGWMLVDDFGPVPTQSNLDEVLAAYLPAVSLLGRMQVALVPRLGDLEALGCPVMPIDRLARWYEELLVDRPNRIKLGQPGGLTPDEHQRLLARTRDVARACERLASFGVPDSLVHNDFWRGNVARGPGGQPLIFDWAEVGIAHAFFALADVHKDIAGWGRSDRTDAIRAKVDDAYLSQWSEYGDADHLREALAATRIPALVYRTWHGRAVAPLRALLACWD